MRAFILPAVLITLSAGAGQAVGQSLDSAPLTSNFTLGYRTSFPGGSLKPGSYVIRIVDHLSDRTILRLETPGGKVLGTFLGLPLRNGSAGASGPVVFASGGNGDKAMRGYAFPGNYAVEFVYPKAEAVKLAVANGTKVQAIDPASDNLQSNTKKLSQEDMQIVTLWTLSPTAVSGNTPAIAASKYIAPTAPPTSTPAYEAINRTPSDIASLAPNRVATPRSASKSATSARKPVLAALPHTASELPSVLLGGLLAMMGALSLRLFNRVRV